ncbi:MAG: IS1595 family transposase [Candidatus Dormibacteraceae bacterium]
MSRTARQPQTLIEAIRHFSDPGVCLDYMVKLRWPDGRVICPTCGNDEVGFIATRRVWECKNKHPRRQFSIKVGTVFEDSPIGLDKWLAAIWLIANAKNGISSYEIARSLGVTQKTAWFMLQRIRLVMQSNDGDQFSGHVEVDETYIGGKARFQHESKRKHIGTGGVGKVAVMGLLERHGPDGHSTVRTQVVPNVRRHALSPEVSKHVAPGSEIYTDALKSYSKLSETYIHKVIDHAERYAEGQVHTNGLENFWSLLKRAIKGTYISVEPFHLFRYLDEQAFRFNKREDSDAGRFDKLAGAIHGKRLTYVDLTGQSLPAAI